MALANLHERKKKNIFLTVLRLRTVCVGEAYIP